MLSIGIGSRTSTGGVVIEGNSGVIFDGLVASSVGHKASCPSCKKGEGEIVAVGIRTVILPGGPAARAGDYVACGCTPGSNVLVAQGSVTVGNVGAVSVPLLNSSPNGFAVEVGSVRRSKPNGNRVGGLQCSDDVSALDNSLRSEGAALASDAGMSEGGYDPSDPNYHAYDVESAICQVDSVCTIESVALANRMHPAPGTLSNTVPVVNGQVSNAHVGYTGDFDDFGPVVHSVSDDGLTVRNTTMAGHKLYPGYVDRIVFQRGNTIYIRTFGEGIGPMGAANEFFARPLWNGLVDGHVRYRINLGYRNKFDE